MIKIKLKAIFPRQEETKNLLKLKASIRHSIAKISIVFGILFFPSCSTTKKVVKQVNNQFETSEAFRQGFTGFMVYNPTTQEVLYERNSEKYFTPASNTKLFTFYSGLLTLGDSVPALKYTVRNDSLIFSGTGDPSFLHEEFSYSKVFDFLRDRKEKLYYAPPNFDEEFFGPGWAWDDYNWYYSVERGAFPIYGNYASFTFKPNEMSPEVVPSYFRDSIEVDSVYSGNTSRATRDLNRNHFRYGHAIGNKERKQEVPFRYSSELVTDLLSDTLNKPVILLEKPMDSFRPVRTIYSIPTDSLYKRMLQVSDNFLAEQILLLSAQQISDTLRTRNAINYIKENHLKDLPDEPVWVDGSGLSVYNKFTPRTMVRLLEKIHKVVPQERLFELLPAGGESGTIKNLYKAEQPYVFAKTGTLSNTHALSGFLRTRSGRILIFSFMNNNYTVPTSDIKAEMEQVLRTIHSNL